MKDHRPNHNKLHGLAMSSIEAGKKLQVKIFVTWYVISVTSLFQLNQLFIQQVTEVTKLQRFWVYRDVQNRKK